ncbi:hypothetical protein Pure05_02890 [Paenarthrobacter ureafaciens]|nr:hypothetical protein Pure01_13050 [Paenarthrobacter ureafaciens]GLU62039.1 hypothetical protein Pure02_02890 [Paenarthrobacter ureafaciens]GLU66313.1 hypothetical protein Pure03_02890 [Paenarthrobacter ureafaciens]GLU71363.1 hypothetical protein Pure04_10780 [Paenarthrobacter ureafaciens]GLU74849.1 hypothetical protein Pure05_02890 [Paenarthrobacter ureafaciens]
MHAALKSKAQAFKEGYGSIEVSNGDADVVEVFYEGHAAKASPGRERSLRQPENRWSHKTKNPGLIATG